MNIFKDNLYTVRFVNFVHDGTPLAKQALVFAMDGKENYLSNVLDFIKMSIKDDKKQSFDYRLDLASADTSIIYIMCRERIYNDDGKLIEFGDWASAKMKLILDYYPLSQYINDEYGITSEI